MQPFAANTLFGRSIAENNPPIETLMHLYDKTQALDLLVAGCGGKLYWMRADTHNVWNQVAMPEGVSSYRSNVWSWVTYEDQGVDVLLISNSKDGMFSVSLSGTAMSATAIATPHKYDVIERYAERIWGGAVDGEPDLLEYSVPYEPTNWEKNQEIPENYAGSVRQPSWDGDAFTALRSFGSQLVAFKRMHVWRVFGTNPGEYEFKEQYGGGVPYPNTVQVDAERIFGLSDQGVVVYDGQTVNGFLQPQCCDVWRRMTRSAMQQSAACLFRGKYYIAFPIDGSTINNAVMIYNSTDGTWLLRTDITVESFLAAENALYYTNSSTPGMVWRWEDDAWETGSASGAACRWVTPWQDLGYKRMNKGPFKFYFLPEVKDRPVVFKVTIQTDKKIRTKEVRVDPQLEWEHKRGESAPQKTLHFYEEGRRFRVIIETEEKAPVWRLASGFMVVCDVSND